MNTKQTILAALFTGLMIVGSKISIPTPFGVPITFQLFFAIYAGLLLSPKYAVLSQVVYVMLGLIGLPVFSAGGGLQYVFNPNFGFIISFVIVAGLISAVRTRRQVITILGLTSVSGLGLLVSYVLGSLYFGLMMNLYLKKPMSGLAIAGIMLPFAIKDMLLATAASVSAPVIIRREGPFARLND